MSYTVSYFIPNTAGLCQVAPVLTIPNAVDSIVDNDFILFLDVNRKTVAMVPTALCLVVTASQ